jgi:hypothetical protein
MKAALLLVIIFLSSIPAFADDIDVNPERVSFHIYETETESGIVVNLFDGFGNRIASPKFVLFSHPKLALYHAQHPHLREYDAEILRNCELTKYKAAMLKRQVHIGTSGIFYCSLSARDISY